MLEELQIKALAELDGWEVTNMCNEEGEDYHILSNSLTDVLSNWGEGKLEEYTEHFPAYPTSYDAIIPLIQKQELGTRLRFYGNCLVLTRAYGLTDSPLELKPAQLAEALLRATNRWIEESNELPCKHEYQEDSTVCTKCGA